MTNRQITSESMLEDFFDIPPPPGWQCWLQVVGSHGWQKHLFSYKRAQEVWCNELQQIRPGVWSKPGNPYEFTWLPEGEKPC